MIWVLLAAATAGLGVWLLIPAPALRRLTPQRKVVLPSFLLGRAGAPPPRTRLMVGFSVTLVFGLLLDGPHGALLALVAGLGAGIGLGYAVKPTDEQDLLRQLPETLEFLAVCLDAGLPMSRCLDTVVEVSPPATRAILAQTAAHLSLGRAGALAWEELRAHRVWGPVAADIARAERSGTALAGVLRAHAQDARQESCEAATKRARTVGTKSVVPLMVCFLPAFVLVGIVPIVIGLLHTFLAG